MADKFIFALLSHGDLGAILKLLALGAQGCCSMGKDPGSYSHKGLEAAKNLEAEKEALPWLARTGAWSLLSLPVVPLRLQELPETQKGGVKLDHRATGEQRRLSCENV